MVAMYQKLSFSDFILFHNSKNRHLEFLNLSPQGLISSSGKKANKTILLTNHCTIFGTPCLTPSNILPFYVTTETGSIQEPSFAALSTLVSRNMKVDRKKYFSTSVILELLAALSIVLDYYGLWAWTVSGFSTNNNHGGFFLIFEKKNCEKKIRQITMVTVKGSLLSFLIVTTSVFLITAPLHSVQAQNTGKQKKNRPKKLSDVKSWQILHFKPRLMQRPKKILNFLNTLVKKLESFFV